MNDPREYAVACDSVSFVAKLALDEVQFPGPVLLNSPKSTFWTLSASHMVNLERRLL
jgi:hypothetical protein